MQETEGEGDSVFESIEGEPESDLDDEHHFLSNYDFDDDNDDDEYIPDPEQDEDDIDYDGTDNEQTLLELIMNSREHLHYAMSAFPPLSEYTPPPLEHELADELRAKTNPVFGLYTAIPYTEYQYDATMRTADQSDPVCVAMDTESTPQSAPGSATSGAEATRGEARGSSHASENAMLPPPITAQNITNNSPRKKKEKILSPVHSLLLRESSGQAHSMIPSQASSHITTFHRIPSQPCAVIDAMQSRAYIGTFSPQGDIFVGT